MGRLFQMFLTDRRKRLGFSILSILLLIILYPQSDALAQVNETPGTLQTYVFEPYTWHVGDHSVACQTASAHHNYIVDLNVELNNPGTNPTLTVQMFRDALESGNYGIFYVHSHAGGNGIAIESYDKTSAGMSARNVAYQNYLNNGYTANQIYKASNGGYHISISGQGIQDWFNDSNTIVFAKGCHTATHNNRWGARDVLGYDETISGLAGCDTFFQRLDGTRDRGASNSRRPVNQADDGIAHLVHTGAGNIVVSPIVTEYAPLPRDIVEEGDSGYVEFDCEMDTNTAANEVLTITGAADLSNMHWVGNHRVEFDIINVEEFSTLSFYVNYNKAISANNGAMLDGNTNPTETNGVGPNRDDFTWNCNTSAVVMMDFEDGTDGQTISSKIPGLTFITTQGYDWIYADKTTGNYNIYPYGSGYYFCNGNFCAWLGPNQGQGRINFTGETATSISMMTTNHYGLYLDAYDSQGNLLDSSYAGPNTQTNRMDQVKVNAANIAYVLVHDTGNYWAIDDLVVVDLLREALAQLPQPFDSLLEELNTINPGAVQSFLVTAENLQDIITFILNWEGSEFLLRIYRPDGTLYGEWQTNSPPITGDIMYPEDGDWIFEVTAIDVPYQNYPYALAAVTPTYLYDVWVAPPDITYSPASPTPGSTVELSVSVHCDNGSDTIPSVTVRFYDGDPNEGGTQIGEEQVVDDIASGTTKTVQNTWNIPDSDPHDIFVVLDPDNDLEEYEEGNNQSFVTIVPPQEIAVEIDICPEKCPNTLDVGSKGQLPLAILGTEVFDVTQIDPDSVYLEGVYRKRYNYEDVTGPHECDCGFDCESPDGNVDMTLKFDRKQIIPVIGEVNDGDVIELTLTGNLKSEFGGTPIQGTDTIIIEKE